MWNDYTSIAHWPNLETRGPFLIHRNRVGGITWVRIYRGEPSRAQYVAQFRETKTGRLTHYIDGTRFGSVESALRFYQKKLGM